ncbi:MAG: hypothetical protein AAFX05_11885, partial [Planctomycetota bacterium]
MNQGWTSIIMFLLILGAPALSWIAGKIREQHELSKARETMRKRREDALRQTETVTREPQAPTAAAPEQRQRADAMRDLAARRQAQLRALRGSVARG